MLESRMRTTYADTNSMIQHQKVAPIIGWEAIINMLEQWTLLLTVILVPGRSNPEVYKLTMLINASEEVNVRRQAQARYQHSMPATLVLIV